MHSHTHDRQFQLPWSLMSVLIQWISDCRDNVCVLKGVGVGVCRCNDGRGYTEHLYLHLIS